MGLLLLIVVLLLLFGGGSLYMGGYGYGGYGHGGSLMFTVILVVPVLMFGGRF